MKGGRFSQTTFQSLLVFKVLALLIRRHARQLGAFETGMGVAAFNAVGDEKLSHLGNGEVQGCGNIVQRGKVGGGRRDRSVLQLMNTLRRWGPGGGAAGGLVLLKASGMATAEPGLIFEVNITLKSGRDIGGGEQVGVVGRFPVVGKTSVEIFAVTEEEDKFLKGAGVGELEILLLVGVLHATVIQESGPCVSDGHAIALTGSGFGEELAVGVAWMSGTEGESDHAVTVGFRENDRAIGVFVVKTTGLLEESSETVGPLVEEASKERREIRLGFPAKHRAIGKEPVVEISVRAEKETAVESRLPEGCIPRADIVSIRAEHRQFEFAKGFRIKMGLKNTTNFVHKAVMKGRVPEETAFDAVERSIDLFSVKKVMGVDQVQFQRGIGTGQIVASPDIHGEESNVEMGAEAGNLAGTKIGILQGRNKGFHCFGGTEKRRSTATTAAANSGVGGGARSALSSECGGAEGRENPLGERFLELGKKGLT